MRVHDAHFLVRCHIHFCWQRLMRRRLCLLRLPVLCALLLLLLRLRLRLLHCVSICEPCSCECCCLEGRTLADTWCIRRWLELSDSAR